LGEVLVDTKKNWLAGIVELGYLPTDDVDLRLKKVALTLVPLIIGLAAFIWATIYFLLGHFLSGSIPLSYAIISLLSLIYFFKTKKTQFIQYSQLLLVLLLPFLLMWSLGGFSAGSMVMIWAIFSPIAALMYLEKREALKWFLAYFVLILISVLIDDYVEAHVVPLPELARKIFYLLNMGVGSAGLYLLVSYEFSEERRSTEADLRVAACAFEAQEGLMVTDANGVILKVNQAFIETTGYTAEEAVGQTARILKSDRHDAAFYSKMWETINRTGKWQGEIWDRRKNGEVYPKWLTISAVKQDDGVVTHYVGSHFDITERKAAEDQIKHLAYYDSLTGLPNRRMLTDRLHRALASSARNSRHGAVFMIDLDNFKALNDTLGHHIGDLLLRQVAHRLEQCVRDGDTVARLGGDEFVVVLENLSEHKLEAGMQVEAIGKKILSFLSQPCQLAEHDYRTTTSIGATLFINNLSPMEDLMKQADIAMYHAKKLGRDTLFFFDPQMQESINERVYLERELRKALEHRQFQLYYQVQVDSSRRPLGAEALIRWNHPERGMISPNQFIPLAEESGLILKIGEWVMETACAQLKAWENNALTCDLVLAVNVSAEEFCTTEFVAQIQASIIRHGIKPSLLKLELTETLLLENMQETILTMNALNEIGVKFSLDDFGTGYSSLQYLKRLPLDQLKIDQSFVRDITVDISDKEIVRTIIAIAQSFKLDVIAEGVETEEQRQFLIESGCYRHQGFLFGKPVPIKQFEAMLKQGSM
jgi:diguanylate cyclase (GGDEF)-like protein/PAS domain S-box-containing protein